MSRGVWLGLLAATITLAQFAVAGCGGRANSNEQGGSAAQSGQAAPTALSARFAMPTTMITLTPSDGITTTETMTESEEAAAEATDTPEPATPAGDLARGENLYATKGCGECHGPAGEGVEGAGAAVAGTSLTFDEFEDLLRTGGGIGPDHLFGTSSISPSGLAALHAWLQSLAPAE
jgi:mono/diheme cytochrome c family protein